MKNERNFMQINIQLGKWVYSLFLLNILIIVYSMKGLIIFGLAPAVTSAFHVFYRWIYFKEFDVSIHQMFREHYNRYFWKSNKLGWIVFTIGLTFVFDIYISQQFIQSQMIHIIILLLAFTYLAVVLYIFPIFVRYDLTILQYFKQAFYITFSSIIQTTALLLSAIIVAIGLYYLRLIVLFFGFTFLIAAISWYGLQGIIKAEGSKNQILQNKGNDV